VDANDQRATTRSAGPDGLPPTVRMALPAQPLPLYGPPMTDRDSVITALAGGWFGSGLSPHARSQLAYCATLRPYPAGAVILREDHETDPFGVATAGRIALRLLVPERGEATIMTVEPGDVVGWSALVPPRRSTSTAVALEPTTLHGENMDWPASLSRADGAGAVGAASPSIGLVRK